MQLDIGWGRALASNKTAEQKAPRKGLQGKAIGGSLWGDLLSRPGSEFRWVGEEGSLVAGWVWSRGAETSVAAGHREYWPGQKRGILCYPFLTEKHFWAFRGML